MKQWNNGTMERGVTLIELVIYVAILGFVTIAVVSMVYPVLKASNRSSASTEIQQNGRFILEKLNQDIGKAESVNQPTEGSPTSDSLSLHMSDGKDTVYEINSGVLTIKIYEGANLLETTELTTKAVSFKKRNTGSDFPYFRLVKNTGSKPTVQINFRIEYKKGTEIILFQDYQTTVSLK